MTDISSTKEERARLIEALPWSAPIYLPTEKMPVEAQIEGLRKVVDIQSSRLIHIYKPQLEALKAKYSGHQRAFIIGNGPSLNSTDLSQLEGEVTFCVNGFFLKMPELNWTPTFYVVEDHLVAEDRADAINALEGPTKLFPAYLAYCLNEGPDTIFFNHRARKSYPHGFDFSTDAAKITYTGCTVTFTCMQLAHYLGFKEIYLIGVDASYEFPDDVETNEDYGTGVLDMNSDDPNHFHPDYFGKGYRWHDPQVSQMIEAYKEARRVTDRLDRPIYNATIGGQLEVFRRRDFGDIFPDAIAPETLKDISETQTKAAYNKKAKLEAKARQAKLETRHSKFPKVALIDMTPASGITATGALKQTLFEGWPHERLMQISSEGTHRVRVDGGPVTETEIAPQFDRPHPVSELLTEFDPDLILYRPLPERDVLHHIAMDAAARLSAPVGVWIMDDWLQRLAGTDPETHTRWHQDFEKLAQQSKIRLSICDAMSCEMEKRFGVPFEAFANAVDPQVWPDPSPRVPGPVRVRYSGGLAEDMTLTTVRSIAEAVEALADTHDIRFEINTRRHWMEQVGETFSDYIATHISSDAMSKAEYHKWLQAADILVVAYNFDPATVAYVKYSMANKLPELLATGRAVLAVGPKGIATIKHIKENKLAKTVLESGVEHIKLALTPLLDDAKLREKLGQKGRSFAFKHNNLETVRRQFQEHVRAAAVTRTTAPRQPDWQRIASLIEAGQPALGVRRPHSRVGPLAGRSTRIIHFFKSCGGLPWRFPRGSQLCPRCWRLVVAHG